MALQATVSGKVELAPLNKTNPLQQWKRVNTQQVGTWFESGDPEPSGRLPALGRPEPRRPVRAR